MVSIAANGVEGWIWRGLGFKTWNYLELVGITLLGGGGGAGKCLVGLDATCLDSAGDNGLIAGGLLSLLYLDLP